MDEAPRLGFLGVGWIGAARLRGALAAGAAQAAAIADRDPALAAGVAAGVGCRRVCADLDELLGEDLDGIVIATPTALHAEQAAQALRGGIPVLCQKPLGRSGAECRELVGLARAEDLLLGVDMSYRHLDAVTAARRVLEVGEIGRPHLAELTFHNAYGPDRAWAQDPELAGGGALVDLGWHLLDLARTFLGELEVQTLHADLFADGRRLGRDPAEVEDLAVAQVSLSDGRALRLVCSWWQPMGSDAVISARFVGPGGAVEIANVEGSFYDFEAHCVRGREVERIAEPGDGWGPRATIAWAQRLAADRRFDPEVEGLVAVAELVDRIYGRPT